MFRSRTVVLILLIFIVLCPLYAQDIFSIGVGANISYAQDITDVESFSFNSDNLAVGLELRTNISYFQLDAVGEVSVINSKTLLLSGILSAGASVELGSIAKLGITFGPRIAYMYTRSFKDSEAKSLSVSNGKDFIEAIKDGLVHIRLMADVYAGPVISVGVAYTIPTNFTISQGNWKELLPNTKALENGQISLCIQMKVF